MAKTGALVGKYFHTFTTQDDGCVTVNEQGHILAQVDDTHYLVEHFDWIIGHPGEQKLVTVPEMVGWQFYDAAESMNFHYQHRGLESRSNRHFDQHKEMDR
jgi:hypothetical protein